MTVEEGLNQVKQGFRLMEETSSLINQAISDAFLFTWQWWLGIGLFIVPWIVWFLLRKKESTGRLLAAGMIAIIIGVTIDIFAAGMGLWLYPMDFIPNSLALFLPYHFSVLPVGVMFTLQIRPNSNPIVKGVIFAGLGVFIVMRFFRMIDFYNPKGWPSIYDFFIMLIIYLVAYLVTNIRGYEKIRSSDKGEPTYNFKFLQRKQKVR
ncbi:hypothetical protein BEP19_03300 [Ammoniphilus oxalaticus]|uniref:Uncharacterized protein n=1 Tax=Ammoniphilus oxalaticus TaxID=66863 RepID=A0A419SNW5_9BACL|nr:CBO0543 family protein [Ammoniphilus oxalaticus]RKD25965.1 hypothetical protein BEP19_03300 [Ammoniphilus oxalaticus]